MGNLPSRSQLTAQLPTSTSEYPKLLDSLAKLSPELTRAHWRNLCTSDLYFLLRYVLRLDKRFEHPWTLARCREVQSEPDGYLDLWSREHFKSSIITYGLTIQDILNDPEVTFGIFSHNRPIAKQFLRQIKQEFEGNHLLKRLFPDILWDDPKKEAPKWSEDDGIVVKRQGNPREATVEAWGLVDGQPIGKHFFKRVYDDVVTVHSVSTPEMVFKTTEMWGLSENLGVAGGVARYVGTRYAFGDTYEEMIKRGIKPRRHPATDNGRPDGNPVYWSAEVWEAKKRLNGPANTACQLLQNPIAGQQAMFNPADLRQWEIRPATLNVYIMVDPARSRKKGSANTAVAVIGVDSGRNKYLLDGFNHRMDLRGRWEAIKAMRNVWVNQTGVQMVKVGYEAYGAEADMDYFLEQMEIEKNSFPIEELRWPRDTEPSKDDRVQRLGPDFRNHKFFIPALISYQGKPHFWKLEAGSAGGLELHYTEMTGPTSQMLRVVREGTPARVAKPIGKVDSEGNLYDLTRHFIEQQMLYPFAPLKDLIDAASRIYDLDPLPPVLVDEKDTLPEVFADGT